jgi:hypothetical protein
MTTILAALGALALLLAGALLTWLVRADTPRHAEGQTYQRKP